GANHVLRFVRVREARQCGVRIPPRDRAREGRAPRPALGVRDEQQLVPRRRRLDELQAAGRGRLSRCAGHHDVPGSPGPVPRPDLQHNATRELGEREMKRLSSLIPVGAALAILAATGVHAHHSFSQFDRNTEVVKTGKVVRWAFNNPHSWLYVNIENEDGTEELWSFEASAPPSLIGRGITGATFEPGDTVTFMYCPLRDGRPAGAIGWARSEEH